MTVQDKIDYALRREAKERWAAAQAITPAARALHTEMADRHADVAWGERERRCEAENPC